MILRAACRRITGKRVEKMLKFVGCGAALYPKLYNSNAYFELGGDLFLLDCGETAFRQHFIAGHFEGKKSVTVIVTHMHTDHIGSLGTLIVYCFLKLGIRVRVVFPETEKLRTVFTLTGVEPEHYTLYADIAESGETRVATQFVRVRHHDVMVHAFGILLTVQGRTLYYSGDAGEIPQQVIALLENGSLEAMYQDTSMHEHSGVHCSFDQLQALIRPEFRDRVYCMHYDGEYFDQYRRAGFRTIEKLVDPPIDHLLEKQ